MFPFSPQLPLGQKKCVKFPFTLFHRHSGAVLWKNCAPHPGYEWHTDVKRGPCWFVILNSSQFMSFLCLTIEVAEATLFCPFSDSCKHWVVSWWLKFGNFVSGREKEAPGSSQFGGKRKKAGGCQNQSQAVWNPAKPWNEQFLSPSLSKLPYFPLSLSCMQHFFTTFLPNPSISQYAFNTLFPVPSYFLLLPLHLPQLIWVRTSSLYLCAPR